MTQRKIVQHKTGNQAILGKGAPSFGKVFRQKVLPHRRVRHLRVCLNVHMNAVSGHLITCVLFNARLNCFGISFE